MRKAIERARTLLVGFKGDRYAFGMGVLDRLGPLTAQVGRKALLVGPVAESWFGTVLETCLASLADSGVEVLGTARGAGPNAPREDVYRLQGHILHKQPEVVVSVDSGSGIDACKAASVLAAFGDVEPEIEPYFGVGKVTEMAQKTGRSTLPVVAAMTAASSGAHLTKYSNVTDPVAGQKKLIVDEAIVPPRAVFDYAITASQPVPLTLDGGLDGISHCLEVYLGVKGDDAGDVEDVALRGIELVVAGLKRFVTDPADASVRELIGLGTDMGGYAIMLGGTNGPHLNSFSLVKYLTHGRACALMCPYYTVFFALAVEERIRKVGEIYRRQGFIDAPLDGLAARELGLVVAQGMIAFNRSIGFPTTLQEVDGVDRGVLEQALEAAKNPQLRMKLQNMPVPLTAETVDRCMGSVLDAAWTGELGRVVNQ